jgi:RNA polymerase sigma-70 factor (ECF subfamily)
LVIVEESESMDDSMVERLSTWLQEARAGDSEAQRRILRDVVQRFEDDAVKFREEYWIASRLDPRQDAFRVASRKLSGRYRRLYRLQSHKMPKNPSRLDLRITTELSNVHLQEWLRGARLGDPSASRGLYQFIETHYTKLARAYRCQYPTVKDNEHTTDLFQDAMLKLCEKYQRHPDLVPEDPESLHIQVVRCLKDIRQDLLRRHTRKKRTKAQPDAEIHSGIADTGTSVSDQLHSREIREKVKAAIDDLPIDKRSTMLLHLEGLTHVQIAGVLGVPVGTVRSRIFRTLDELRPRLMTLLP